MMQLDKNKILPLICLHCVMGCKQAQIKTSQVKLKSTFEQEIFLQKVFILLPVHAFPIMIQGFKSRVNPCLQLNVRWNDG